VARSRTTDVSRWSMSAGVAFKEGDPLQPADKPPGWRCRWRRGLRPLRNHDAVSLIRYLSMRDTHWIGYKVHLTETCDAGQPELITQMITTSATTPDCVMGPTIHHDLAQRDLLPGTHLLDSGYVDADLLVIAQTMHQIDVVGPPFGSYRRRRRAGQGYERWSCLWNAEVPPLTASARRGHASTGRPAISMTGRISTVPKRASGIRAAMRIASARSLASIRE
jgi:hypothetical protein